MPEPALKVALVALNRPGYRSLALGYVRAFAQADERLRRKIGFQTLDLTDDVDPWPMAYQILRIRPDVVGFSVMCWNARTVYEACELVRKADPGIAIVLGGPEVGPQAEHVLADNPSVDMVVRGEGEETFADLLRVLVAGKRTWMVPGVTARNGEAIVSAPDRPLIEDLDSIPSPYLAGVLAPAEMSSYIETFRGCPHRCSYCFEAKGSQRIRSFSQGRVRAEIDALATAPGVRMFSFSDAVFNLNGERLSWLADALEPHARRGIRLHTIEVDIERIGEAEATALRRAGVLSVETGPQTIGERALRTCRRTFDPERFSAGVNALKAVAISVECDLIIGLPGDTAFDVVAGVKWLLDLDPGVLQTSTLRVLPGTDLWADAQKLGLEFDSGNEHEIVRTAEMTFADIRRLEVMTTAVQKSYRARIQA